MLGGLTACGGGLSGASGDASPRRVAPGDRGEPERRGAGESLDALPALDALEARPSPCRAGPAPDDPGPTPTRGQTLSATPAALPAPALGRQPARCNARPRAGGQRRPGPAHGQQHHSRDPRRTQIRAACKLPSIASATRRNSAEGQTIYIVNAGTTPTSLAELAAFNSKFSLPSCSNRTLTATTTLPLTATSSNSSCELVIAYSTSGAALSNTAPAYDSGWAPRLRWMCSGRAPSRRWRVWC